MDYFDVLFAKANGVSSSTCENTGEALLEATAGFSAKNLFDNKWRQGTPKNATTTTSVCSTTVIKTENGVTHKFKNFNTAFVFRVWGLNQAGMNEILSGTGAESANVIYDSNYIRTETFEVTNSNANVVAYCVMVRKPETQGAEDWIDVTPSDVPDNLIMCVESPLSIGSFEAYKKPLNEAKQDKPVILWEAALNSSGVSEVPISSLADNVANYSYLKVVITNEVGSTITDQETIMTNVEYEPTYIGQNVAQSTAILGFHEVDGHLVFDRLFIWVSSNGIKISVIGLRDHNETVTPPDTVSGVFIRKIIGIPK